MNDLFRRLEQLNEIGVALSAEREIQALLEKILVAAKEITRADGGTLYQRSDDGSCLVFRIVRTDSLALAYGGITGQPPGDAFPDLPLFHPDGRANDSMVAAQAALSGCTINIADAYSDEGFDFSGTRRFDASTGYRSRSFLTVPMKDHAGEVIGVLQLINAIDPDTGEVGIFSEADQQLAESLASQAAIALTNRQLVAQLEGLFEAFIKLINLAIDEKSPHTGGHCQRVPELTMMLADAVDAIDDGPLADFKLSDKDRYELRIAALMHDCGKVTTPVHVVEKATKLQTIFDRIALVDTRFELLRRDAEIRKLKAIAVGGNAAQAAAEYQAFSAQLDADREFLRQANKGAERMRDEDLARIKQIASDYHWRNPVGEEVPLLDADELDNLSIRAGTLTAAEREIINHHIVATIRMLEQLPWPKHLQKVPEYAGGHHERMDGKGYPKGLKREEMSLPARMMGIADIFEALTAKDRPYKQAMKLSEAMKIMENFRNNGHIDPDLFDAFVRQGVHRRYGEAFLDQGQVDC